MILTHTNIFKNIWCIYLLFIAVAKQNHQEINYQQHDRQMSFNQSKSQQNRQVQEQNDPEMYKWPILKPNPIFQSDNLQYCNTTLNSKILTFNINQKQYLALGLKYCGFIIYNLQNPYFPQVEFQESFKEIIGQVNGFSLDGYRNLLLVAHSSGNIYQVNISSIPMSIQLSLQTAQLKYPLALQNLPNINNVILIICQDEIQVFSNQINQNTDNNSNLSHFTYHKSIPISINKDILHVQFDFNNNICLIGCYIQGVLLFKLLNPTSQDIQFESIATIKPSWSYLSRFQLTSQNILYYLGEFQGIFALDLFNCLKYQNKESCQDITPFYQFHSNSKAGVFFINKQETYLFSQYRQVGLKILDIQQKQIKAFQSLEIQGDVQDIQLSLNESYLFYTNTFNFLIYEFQTKIHNFQKPNLLQNIVQMSQEKNYMVDNIYSIDPCCKYDDNRNILFLCRYSQGISIFKKEVDGVIKNINNIQIKETSVLIIDLVFFLDFKIAYVQQYKKGMSIIDFTDPQNPLIIKENITFGVEYPLFMQITCNYQESLCFVASQFTGVIIFDIMDLLDPVFQSIFQPQSLSKSVRYGRSCFMHNQDIAFVVVYEYGLVVVDLSDPKTPLEISRLKTDETTFALQDNKYCLCTSSYKGLMIIDISDLKDLKLMSQVKLFGAVISFKFLQNEQYAIVASYENSALFLVEIIDKSNPILIQTLKRKQQEGFHEVCLDKDENQGFISTSRGGVLFLKLKSDIFVHIEKYEVAQVKLSNQKQFISIDPSIPLKVGQTIQFNIIPLYQDYPIAVVNAFLYQNYNLKNLKKWMIFSSDKLLLELNINKESLEQEKDGTFLKTKQQIIFQIHKTILETSFTNDYLKIDEKISKKIFLACQLQEYIGESNMAAITISSTKKLDIDIDQIYGIQVDSDQKEDIIKYIRYILQHSILYYPIEYVITPSLQYDLNDPNSNYISSTQQRVIVTINIKKLGQGLFVNKIYSGILVIVSQQQEEIMLDGDVQKINYILTQKLKFVSLIDQDNISFILKIEDGVNHPIQKEVSYQNAQFISEQKKIQINDESELQRDFNSKYESSIIYILERFYYKIPSGIFQAEDETILSYIAQIKSSDGDFINIPSNFWMQFSQNDQTFYGTPSSKEFLNLIEIQVQVTDNYSFATQRFQVKVYRIPLSFIIQQLFQIGGPLLGLIGIWNYYYVFYNFIYKKYYTFSKETVQVGELYVKQIIINDENIEQANQILKIFKQTIPKKMIKQQIYDYYSQKQQFEQNNLKQVEQEFSQTVQQQTNSFNNDSQELPKIQQIQNGFDLLYEKQRSNFEIQERLPSSPSHFLNQKQKYQKKGSLSSKNKFLLLSQFHTPKRMNILQSQNQIQDQVQFSINKQESQKKLDIQVDHKESTSSISPSLFSLSSPLNLLKSQAQRKHVRLDGLKSPQQLDNKSKLILDEDNKIFKFGVQRNENSIKIPVDNIYSQSPINRIIDTYQKSNFQINKDELGQKIYPNLFSPQQSDLNSQQQIFHRKDNSINGKLQQDKNNQGIYFDKQEDINYNQDSKINEKIQFFDDNGNLQTELIIRYFIRLTFEQKNLNSYEEKLFQKLLKKNDIVRKTFESLLCEYILKQDTFSSQVFKQLYKRSNKFVTPDWYKNYCVVSTDPQNIQENPLPFIDFKEDILSQQIQKILLQFKKALSKQNQLENIPIIIPLIKNVMKGYIFGFLNQKLILNSLSAGESIICEVHKIKQIRSLLKIKSGQEENNLSFFQKLKKFCLSEYTEKALIDNSKLPSWITSVDFINNNILIIGNPQPKDIGFYPIFVYNKKNLILRQFDIQVI